MIKLPEKEGWYWVKIKGYYGGPKWFPCWISGNDVLVGGLGDSSSNNTTIDEIDQIGDEIIEPTA